MFKIDGQYRTSIIVDPPNGRLPEISSAGKTRRATLKQKGWFKNDGTALVASDRAKALQRPRDPASCRPLPVPGRRDGANAADRLQQPEGHRADGRPRADPRRVYALGAGGTPQFRALAGGHALAIRRFDRLVGRRHNQFLFRTRRAPRRLPCRRTVLATGSGRFALPVHRPRLRLRPPYTGEYPWPKTDTSLYEYACHEGNYAMGNTLRGARQLEKVWIESRGTTVEGAADSLGLARLNKESTVVVEGRQVAFGPRVF